MTNSTASQLMAQPTTKDPFSLQHSIADDISRSSHSDSNKRVKVHSDSIAVEAHLDNFSGADNVASDPLVAADAKHVSFESDVSSRKSTSTAKDDPDGQLYGIFGGSSDAIKSLPLAALGDIINGQE